MPSQFAPCRSTTVELHKMFRIICCRTCCSGTIMMQIIFTQPPEEEGLSKKAKPAASYGSQQDHCGSQKGQSWWQLQFRGGGLGHGRMPAWDPTQFS